MLPPAMLLSSGWPIIHLNFATILSFNSQIFHTHEIIVDDIDEKENEEITKHQHHFVKTIANVCMPLLHLITLAVNQDSTTNSMKISLKSHPPFLNTSFKVLHQKMHIDVMDLIAPRDQKLNQR